MLQVPFARTVPVPNSVPSAARNSIVLPGVPPDPVIVGVVSLVVLSPLTPESEPISKTPVGEAGFVGGELPPPPPPPPPPAPARPNSASGASQTGLKPPCGGGPMGPIPGSASAPPAVPSGRAIIQAPDSISLAATYSTLLENACAPSKSISLESAMPHQSLNSTFWPSGNSTRMLFSLRVILVPGGSCSLPSTTSL